MSAYSTLTITRKEAEHMVRECRALNDKSVRVLSDKELDNELHGYVYAEQERYYPIVGLLRNYIIKSDD